MDQTPSGPEAKKPRIETPAGDTEMTTDREEAAAAPPADESSSDDEPPAPQKKISLYPCGRGCGCKAFTTPSARNKHHKVCKHDPFEPADGDSAKVQALKREAAAIKARATTASQACNDIVNWCARQMEPYMKRRDWNALAKKLPGNPGKFYMMCQYVDGTIGEKKKVTPAVLKARVASAAPGAGRAGRTVAATLERARNESHLGAGGAAAIAQATANDDASMAREAGNWARSISFTLPRAPYAPIGAADAGFPVPDDIPDDPAESARLMVGRADRLVEASRERLKDAPPY